MSLLLIIYIGKYQGSRKGDYLFLNFLWYWSYYEGHLHPKLEVPGLTYPWNRTWASRVGGEHSRKEPVEQLVNSYSEHLHMSPRQYHIFYGIKTNIYLCLELKGGTFGRHKRAIMTQRHFLMKTVNGKSVAILSGINERTVLFYLSYIHLGFSVCHPVCHPVCRPVVVAERWVILYVLAIKLTKETRRRVCRGRD
jgi:hypothetical protein